MSDTIRLESLKARNVYALDARMRPVAKYRDRRERRLAQRTKAELMRELAEVRS